MIHLQLNPILAMIFVRKITIHENPWECLRQWNNIVSAMDSVWVDEGISLVFFCGYELESWALLSFARWQMSWKHWVAARAAIQRNFRFLHLGELDSSSKGGEKRMPSDWIKSLLDIESPFELFMWSRCLYQISYKVSQQTIDSWFIINLSVLDNLWQRRFTEKRPVPTKLGEFPI